MVPSDTAVGGAVHEAGERAGDAQCNQGQVAERDLAEGELGGGLGTGEVGRGAVAGVQPVNQGAAVWGNRLDRAGGGIGHGWGSPRDHHIKREVNSAPL